MSVLLYKKIKHDYISLNPTKYDKFILYGGEKIIRYKNNITKNGNYYFVHMTKNYNSLRNILKTGILKKDLN